MINRLEYKGIERINYPLYVAAEKFYDIILEYYKRSK